MSWFLISHIVIALSSVVVASYNVLKPTANKLQFTYLAMLGTLLSGTVLVVAANTGLVRACISGLIYIAVTFGLSMLARQRLSKIQVRSRDDQL